MQLDVVGGDQFFPDSVLTQPYLQQIGAAEFAQVLGDTRPTDTDTDEYTRGLKRVIEMIQESISGAHKEDITWDGCLQIFNTLVESHYSWGVLTRDENKLARDAREDFTRYVRELWNSRSLSYFSWWANGSKTPRLPLRNWNGNNLDSQLSLHSHKTGWGGSAEETRLLLNECATRVCGGGRPEVASFMADYLYKRMPPRTLLKHMQVPICDALLLHSFISCLSYNLENEGNETEQEMGGDSEQAAGASSVTKWRCSPDGIKTGLSSFTDEDVGLWPELMCDIVNAEREKNTGMCYNMSVVGDNELQSRVLLPGEFVESLSVVVPRYEDSVCPNGHKLDVLGTSRDNGWSCSGMNFDGGCKKGCTGFHQTEGWKRWQCKRCDFDLCEGCLETERSHLISVPKCYSGHAMKVSDGSGYYTQYGCDECGKGGSGVRWFCSECYSDICFKCRPDNVPQAPLDWKHGMLAAVSVAEDQGVLIHTSEDSFKFAHLLDRVLALEDVPSSWVTEDGETKGEAMVSQTWIGYI